MKEIVLKGGHTALVDDADYEQLAQHKWFYDPQGYAQRNKREPDGRLTTIRMHREILGLVKGDVRQGDHINLNKLDNRRCNLRICTRTENMRNRRGNPKAASGLKGITKMRKRKPHHADRWIASIKVGSENKYLGCFESPELAHEFYCLAADLLHGEFANYGH